MVALTPEESPDYPAMLNNLGTALRTLYKATGDPDALEEVVANYRKAVKLGEARNPVVAVTAGRNWMPWAYSRDAWDEVVEAYPSVLSALEALLLYQTGSPARTPALSKFEPLPSLVAYARVKRGEPREAVLALESGRTFVLREALERARRDLERLPSLGYQALYDRFKKAERRLRELEGLPPSVRRPDWLSQLDAARQELQGAASAIREEAGKDHPEFRFLLKPLPLEEIQELAREAPLVYLAATLREGTALIVTSEGTPRIVPLPRLSEGRLWEVLVGPEKKEPRGYLGAYQAWLEQKPGSEAIETWFRAIEDALGFLGGALRPLREALKEGGHKRAVLVPDGLLSLFPLHAARFDDGTHFLEHVTFTYVPSAHVLYHARLSARSSVTEPLLAVENPNGNLECAHYEVDAVRKHFQKVVHLPGEKATREAVMRELPGAGVFHFAGHGLGGWWRGGEGTTREPELLLSDGSLCLSEFFRDSAAPVYLRLAVLSACETGVPDTKVLNEGLNLPAGLLLAGTAGAVGSLWSVSDYSTAGLIARLYENLFVEEQDAAEALRQAQLWMLREGQEYSHPYYWAAFGHYGVPVRMKKER